MFLILPHTLTLTLRSAFFDLHESILQNSDLHELHETSRAALEATVRMVVDVARSFNRRAPTINLEVLPPRCSHLARAAQHLIDISENVTYEESKSESSEIREMLTRLDRRWRMAGRYICHGMIVWELAADHYPLVGKQLARLEAIFWDRKLCQLPTLERLRPPDNLYLLT